MTDDLEYSQTTRSINMFMAWQGHIEDPACEKPHIGPYHMGSGYSRCIKDDEIWPCSFARQISHIVTSSNSDGQKIALMGQTETLARAIADEMSACFVPFYPFRADHPPTAFGNNPEHAKRHNAEMAKDREYLLLKASRILDRIAAAKA